MAPPQRRSGEGGRTGKSAGRGRGRGGGGGGRGARSGATAETSPTQDATVPHSETARNPKSKPPRKTGSGGRGSNAGTGGTGGTPASRPARNVSVITRKVLIRNIPHDWDEDKIFELVESHGGARQRVWRFVAGKIRTNNRVPRPGRLYLDFKKDTEEAKTLIDNLNGHHVGEGKLLDVDFAPFQKVPREKQRKDAKVGTIDRDPDYMAFLESLSKPKEKLPSADVAADSKEAQGGAEKPVAALVQFLNERKRDKKVKSKFGGKSEKARGTRSKSTKDGKLAKEKGKNSKAKTKASESTAVKDAAKPRKTRGKSTKEKYDGVDNLEPGNIAIMGAKTLANRNDAAQPNATESASSEDLTKVKPGGGKNKSSSAKPSRRTGQASVEAGGGEAPSLDLSGKEGSKGVATRGRRDSRAGRGSKGNGRGDQPKKVFAPKNTTPAS